MGRLGWRTWLGHVFGGRFVWLTKTERTIIANVLHDRAEWHKAKGDIYAASAVVRAVAEKFDRIDGVVQ